MSDPALAAQLEQGLAAMGLVAAARVRRGMLDYLDLLEQWNRVYNLTAKRATEDWVSLHLLDSLSLLPFLPQGRLLDIGSGAGLPGLVIALLQPEREVVVLDSNAKKTRFLTHAVTTLALQNVKVVHSRVDAYRPPALFAAVTSRAFAELSEFVHYGLPLCRPADGILLAMKGRYPAEELRQLGDEVIVRSVDAVDVPGLNAQRHIVSLIPKYE